MNRQDAAPGSGFLYLGLAVDFASPFRHSSAAPFERFRLPFETTRNSL